MFSQRLFYEDKTSTGKANQDLDFYKIKEQIEKFSEQKQENNQSSIT
ncbi:hypothetical protein pb186bvf_018104 [Paramecium bursaria]